MALFSRSKKEKEEVKPKKETAGAAPVAKKDAPVSAHAANLSGVILGPRITEKATEVAGKNVFVFNVHPDATKERIASAVKALYKVTPRKVAVVNIKQKKVTSTRRRTVGYTAGGKKAYVYLKEGDKIEFA